MSKKLKNEDVDLERTELNEIVVAKDVQEVVVHQDLTTKIDIPTPTPIVLESKREFSPAKLPEPTALVDKPAKTEESVKARHTQPVKNNGGTVITSPANEKTSAVTRQGFMHKARPDKGIKNV